jgi:hypothetical protein
MLTASGIDRRCAGPQPTRIAPIQDVRRIGTVAPKGVTPVGRIVPRYMDNNFHFHLTIEPYRMRPYGEKLPSHRPAE